MSFCSYTYVNRIMHCVKPIRCPTSFWNSLSKSKLIYLSILYHLTYQFDTLIDGNYLQPITYHTASCSKKKSIFLRLFSLLEILHLGWEASVVYSWKKNARLQSHDLNAKTRCFKTQKLILALRLKEKTSLPFWVKRSADNLLASFF